MARRKPHRLDYYLEQMKSASPREIADLLLDAAHQNKKYISAKDYETLYWSVAGQKERETP